MHVTDYTKIIETIFGKYLYDDAPSTSVILGILTFLSYAPVRPPLQERRRMSEANHSLSKCGDIRAQIHIGPSQYVSHYFFCS